MTIKIIIFIILLMLSALFSGSEIVYSKVNILRLEREQNNSKLAKEALDIATNFSNTISTILIGNNLVNVAMSSLGAILALDIASSSSLNIDTISIYSTILVTILVITFGEIIPKTIFQNYSYTLSKVFVYFVKFFKIIFYPIVYLIDKLSNKIIKPIQNIKTEDDNDLTSLELLNMTDELESNGSLDSDDAELVKSAIEFTETVAWEIMTPRVDVLAYNIDDGFENIINDSDFYDKARVILYQETIDNVKGFIDTTKVLKNKLLNQEITLENCLYEPLYIHKTMPLSLVLKELKSSHKHLAIVLDEWGGMYGILTIEDILEELFGEIRDELDEEQEKYIKISNTSYIVDGDMAIYDFFDLVGIDIHDFDTDYSTVAGLCTEVLDKIPSSKDELDFMNLHLIIKRVIKHRVEKVLVTINNKSDE